MATASPVDGSLISKCSAWYASLPGLAKFCNECATYQNLVTDTFQKDGSSSSAPKADEVSSSSMKESAVSDIQSDASQTSDSPSTAANQTSNLTSVGSVDKGFSRQKKLLLFFGIAVVVIVLAYLLW